MRDNGQMFMTGLQPVQIEEVVISRANPLTSIKGLYDPPEEGWPDGFEMCVAEVPGTLVRRERHHFNPARSSVWFEAYHHLTTALGR